MQHNAYNYHRRSCKNGNKCLSEALTKAKEYFKRRKIHEPSQEHNQTPQTGEVILDTAQHVGLMVRWLFHATQLCSNSEYRTTQ